MGFHGISTFILITHWLIVVGLSVRVIVRRPPVGVSVAWLAVIYSVPFVGAAAYLLFGEKRLGRRRASRIMGSVSEIERWQTGLREEWDAASMKLEGEAAPLCRYIERVLGFSVLCGNQVELLDNFESIFDAIVADIDAAKKRCQVCFYIWHVEGRAGDVVEALIRAARCAVPGACRCNRKQGVSEE